MTNRPVLQLRVALTTADHDRLLRFYCEGLGLEHEQVWTNEQGRAVLLPLGRATLELFDEQQAATVDAIETGQRLSGPVRLALQVPDLDAALARLAAHGAIIVHAPVVTPWGDRNARVQDPDGMQVTLFQEAAA
jgi:uncharacterized glyoxalase superfamily protein PhnB